MNRQAGSQSNLGSVDKSQASEVDPDWLVVPHDLAVERNRYVGPLDTALYSEFL